ncbi:U-box domain-containing protein 4-like [Ananas comosus]|uniref:U-box domain-containing protein 4-like n=1 Tax=Ananas comosus TaxID=4615 RepID=A0A6P5G1J4_ANACO|nr:U-box domain-containing protein 4-like [Ananas comosus]
MESTWSRSSGEGSGEGSGGAASSASLGEIMERIRSDDREGRIEAAREIRRLTKTSSRHRRWLSGAVPPLVAMLRSGSEESAEAAILALLNLGVKDERNKINIVEAGALEPIIHLLQSPNPDLQEYATAAVLTLTASSANKLAITTTGAIPLLVEVLKEGNAQAKADAVTALYNLSTLPDNLKAILSAKAIPPLINLLRTIKKSSKTAEKCSALIEPLLNFEEGRNALINEEGGVLTVVELLEEGSLQSKEHIVGALLTMCESNRSKYREIILKEGVIPGLLELTVKGTPNAQYKARKLLQLLRDSPYPRSEFQADTIENIVSNIVAHIDRDDRAGKAKKMLAEMVQVSMEQSLRHLQQRALVCTPSEPPLSKCPSGVPFK